MILINIPYDTRYENAVKIMEELRKLGIEYNMPPGGVKIFPKTKDQEYDTVKILAKYDIDASKALGLSGLTVTQAEKLLG